VGSVPHAVGTSRRVDETYVLIRGRPCYLFRTIDKHRNFVDFLLRRDRGNAAAQPFFRQALGSTLPGVPRTATFDRHLPSRRALWLPRRGYPCWRNIKVGTNK
jgi:transposase-like protein